MRKILAIVLLLLLALPFLSIRIRSWPVTWFDEGAYLQGAKNLTLYGEYAILSGGKFHRFDPMLTGTGPTVLLPISALFHLSGIGLAQGRFISTVYALGAIVICFELATQMMSRSAAVFATGLMVWAPWSDFIRMGRFAMGEMASLFFVMGGLYLTWRSIERGGGQWRMLSSGVAFGLATLSKPQIVIVLGAIALVGLIDLLHYHQIGFGHWGLLLMTASLFLVGWHIYQAYVLGLSEWMSRMQTGDAFSRVLATILRPGRVLGNFNNLAENGYLLWATPAFAYFAFDVLREEDKMDSVKKLAFLAVVLVWLLWYVWGSIGWIRYAFVPISLSSLLLGKLFDVATGSFDFNPRIIIQALGGSHSERVPLRLSLALLPTIAIGYGMLINVDSLLNEGSQSPQRIAQYIDANLDADVLIETWEWEISFLSHKQFHHPPFDVLEKMIRRDRLGIISHSKPYSPDPFDPDYVIDGPYSKWTHLYDDFIKERCFLVNSIGSYDLYNCK